MVRIYRVSGLKSAGSASIVARAITASQMGLHVRVDVEQGLVNVQGQVNDYAVASAIRDAGCDYLGVVSD
jgi:hypothetical protein